ncbi:type II restriction endonuclease [Burkholderia orbicola]|uniref:Type II restriction endonuclease n=2 Tax=Burkholderia cepacia complex TaxID=87882 RepID=A0A427P360_9BURK|nr:MULTISPECIES: type II restriction endonuclease [Burkholderia cepacia complex]MBJ9923826.1 type II restriction endonuclease [Burkholderia cenocepacia]MCA8404771.1 type II restriction endonuclease [Burkholderia cenocepacia]MDN7528286.1 type II restriction endonuclease [Burkholderia orbicola]MDN7734713.1 type II restriction endonuclease [Burkholderia orbicola]MDN7994926.1 type II restriction endonuclease [Burkholderia orbicola]
MTNKAMGLSPACLKTLAPVEANPNKSNQHELNGVIELKAILGLNDARYSAIFSVRGEPITAAVDVTWYDARAAHPTRTEHRLYFETNAVMERAQAGDDLLIGFDKQGQLHCILIPRSAAGGGANTDAWVSVT